MKQFVFRLQTVLDHAQEEEEARQRHLAKLCQTQAHLLQEVAWVMHQQEEVMNLIASTQQGTFDPRDLQGYRLRLDEHTNNLSRLREEQEKLDALIAAARASLLEAALKRKVLEKLREKHQIAYRKEVERTELKTMEEAVLPRLERERRSERARWDVAQHEMA